MHLGKGTEGLNILTLDKRASTVFWQLAFFKTLIEPVKVTQHLPKLIDDFWWSLKKGLRLVTCRRYLVATSGLARGGFLSTGCSLIGIARWRHSFDLRGQNLSLGSVRLWCLLCISSHQVTQGFQE